MDIEIKSSRLVDVWEAAALQALTEFCAQHPVEVTNLPIGIFPAANVEDLAWLDRVDMDILGYICLQETVLTSTWCMNALLRLYQRQKESMDILLEAAQVSHLTVNDRNK